jgi:hypothetical protein
MPPRSAFPQQPRTPTRLEMRRAWLCIMLGWLPK